MSSALNTPLTTPLNTAVPAHHKVPLGASLLAVAAGTTWSFGALTARLARHSDAWQYLLWRSIGVIAVIELLAGVRGSRTLRTVTAFRSGWQVMAASASLLVASLGYVYAVKTTTAANAAFLASITPLAAVVLARVVLGERLTAVTVGALSVATLGLVVMVSADVSAGDMRGNVAALLSAVGFASYSVCLRTSTERDWSLVMPGYAALMVGLCAAVTMAKREAVVLPWRDTGLALFHGGVLIVAGTTLYNLSSRRVPTVAMTVFAQSETVFAPVWVFLVLDERPGAQTLLGGALILAAVIGKALLDARPAPIAVGLPA